MKEYYDVSPQKELQIARLMTAKNVSHQKNHVASVVKKAWIRDDMYSREGGHWNFD